MENFKSILAFDKGKISYIVILVLFLGIVLGIAFFGDKIPLLNRSRFQVKAPSPTPNATAAFLTYTNFQFNFTFTYPNSWQVQELNLANEKVFHSVLQISPKGFKGSLPPIKMFYIANPKSLSLGDLEKNLNTKDSTTPLVYSPSDTYILSGQGLPAYFRDNSTCNGAKCQVYIFAQGQNVYLLENFTDVNNNSQQEIYKQIFNSLKFK